MGVQAYYSTDTSAPQLSGTVGSLIAVLDACLVNGYGAKSAAGWTKPYSGTNKAVYRNSATSGTGFYLNIQDNGPGSGGAQEARAWGYTACTAQDTGTGQFPTTAQRASGLAIRKSATANSTTRPWTLIADATVFYLFVDTGDYTTPNYSQCFHFGDFFSYKSGDTANCAISGRIGEGNGSYSYEGTFPLALVSEAMVGTNVSWRFIAQSYTGVGGAIPANLMTGLPIQGIGSSYRPVSGCNSWPWSQLGLTYPNAPDGACELSPNWLTHDNAIHGYLKGVWTIQHAQPFAHGDTFSGTGNMAGKTFIALNVMSISSSYQFGQIAIETSNTWS